MPYGGLGGVVVGRADTLQRLAADARWASWNLWADCWGGRGKVLTRGATAEQGCVCVHSVLGHSPLDGHPYQQGSVRMCRSSSSC